MKTIIMLVRDVRDGWKRGDLAAVAMVAAVVVLVSVVTVEISLWIIR